MSKLAPTKRLGATSADWTRGYRSALAKIEEPVGDYTSEELAMFMRGYRTAMEEKTE